MVVNLGRGLAHLDNMQLVAALPGPGSTPTAPQNPFSKRSIAPTPALRPYVRQFLIVEYNSGTSNRLLPGPGVVTAFRFKGSCLLNGTSAPKTLVTGLSDKARTLTHSGNCGNVITIFTAMGASAILRDPLEELFNGSMPLETQVPRSRLDLVEEQIAETPHHHRRVEAIERFLQEHIREREPDFLITAAVASIHKSRGTARVADLAHTLGVSQSTLERRFRRAVGASPKKFAALVRLRHVLGLRHAGMSLTEVAYSAGYADQAHFIKDFKRIAQETPETFFESSTAFC